jgi:spore coat polysaccharide biosynthesis protein SpsF
VKTVAIVQARMGSSRLPGKVLADLGGAPMLARVIERARAAATISAVVVATTTDPADDALVPVAVAAGAAVYRGSTDDVLARYLGAARATAADVVVRLTADCPLLDPAVIDAVVEGLLTTPGCAYASNTHQRTFPRGLDVEAMLTSTLARLDELATSPAHREHVTAYLLDHPAAFTVMQLHADADHASLRWTVDTERDLAVVRRLYVDAGAHPRMPYQALVAWLARHPHLATANADVPQRSWRHAAAEERRHG